MSKCGYADTFKGKVDKVEAYYGLQGSMMGRNQLTVDKPFSSPIEVDNS